MQKSVGGSKVCGVRRWMRVALRWPLTLSKVAEGIVPRVNLSMLRAHSASAPRSRDLVLVLSGPTATGKSAVAVEIARRLGGEIVSADSVQLYKGLDIGSGKITRSEMRGIPHHCIDVFDASHLTQPSSAPSRSIQLPLPQPPPTQPLLTPHAYVP